MGGARAARRAAPNTRAHEARIPAPASSDARADLPTRLSHPTARRRFLRRRAKDDKGPEDATTSTQVLEMYRSQASVSNMGGKDVDLGEDESD